SVLLGGKKTPPAVADNRPNPPKDDKKDADGARPGDDKPKDDKPKDDKPKDGGRVDPPDRRVLRPVTDEPVDATALLREARKPWDDAAAPPPDVPALPLA